MNNIYPKYFEDGWLGVVAINEGFLWITPEYCLNNPPSTNPDDCDSYFKGAGNCYDIILIKTLEDLKKEGNEDNWVWESTEEDLYEVTIKKPIGYREFCQKKYNDLEASLAL